MMNKAGRIFLAVFLAGVVSLLLELSLLREFVYIFGSTARTNALIISVFLVGLAGGSYAGTWSGFDMTAERARERFCRLQLLNIVYIVFFYASKWYFVYHCPWQLLVHAYFLVMVVFPAFMAGLGYSFIVKILHASGEKAITWVYGVSTLGSVAGGLMHGLWLVPVWGMKSTYLAAIAGAGLAMAAMGMSLGRRGNILALLLALVSLAAVFLDPFRPLMYSPRVLFSQDSEFGLVEVWKLKPDGARRAHERLGRGNMPYFPPESVVDMKINAVHQAYNLPIDRRIHEDWTRASLQITGAPARVLLFGYASGVTADAYLRSPLVAQLDIVENCHPVIEAARVFFGDEYTRVMADARARLIVDDFRGYARFAQATYDIIAIDHSLQDPYQSGYFTTEFFDQLKGMLSRRGVIILLGQGLSWNTMRLSFEYIYQNRDPQIAAYIHDNCLFLMRQLLPAALAEKYALNTDPLQPGGLVYGDDRIWPLAMTR